MAENEEKKNETEDKKETPKKTDSADTKEKIETKAKKVKKKEAEASEKKEEEKVKTPKKKVKKVIVEEVEEEEEGEEEDAEEGEEDEETEVEEEEEIEIIEEEEKYTVKIKPKLSAEMKKKLKLRQKIKKNTPEFKRQEWFRYQRLGTSWRRPRGLHSKMRKHKGYRVNVVSIGYGSPKETRNLHPSGFEEVMVYNPKDLDKIDPKSQAARVGHSVGTRKRIEIEEAAGEKGIRVLNPRRA